MTHRGRAVAVACLALLAVTTAACAPGPDPRRPPPAGSRLSGPLAALLAASTDRGPSSRPDIASVVSLAAARRPVGLQRWAARRGLQVGWHRGHRWASLSGPAPAMSAALGVAIHDYRSRTGHDFYAAVRQPGVPADVAAEVTRIGRVLNYGPPRTTALHTMRSPGLGPSQLITAYDAGDLSRASGDTTRTVVFFEYGAYRQADLDSFARSAGLPSFSPEMFNGTATSKDGAGETELDVEVVHAIAPHARLVVVDAEPTLDGSTGTSVGLAIGQLFTRVDQRFPGAVWSLSIGWGCERLYTAADVQPAEDALEAAEAHGTTAFDASGDTAGLECKGGHDYSTPPGPSDIGLDTIASLPAMTSVGGTRLSTDAQGHWAAEQAWDYSALSQGGSGGVSTLHARPSWQAGRTLGSLRGAGRRLVPDVSADADPDTGVTVVLDGEQQQGGRTSQAAPIWAGFTVLMDDYLQHHGGHLVGAINPVLYRIAQVGPRPAFHDITLGGDAVDLTGSGFDLVTGLGTPMIDNLVQDVLGQQRSGS